MLDAAGQDAALAEDVLPLLHRASRHQADNVMVSTEGAVQLADLGLAKATRSSEEKCMTMLSSGVMGPPQYLPPEPWRSPNVEPPADVWALGATLCYLLAARARLRRANCIPVR